MTPGRRRTIIPPHVEDQIEQNSTEAVKAQARKNRILSERVRGMRIAGAKRAYEPQHGEQREVRDAENSTNDEGPVLRVEDSADSHDLFIDDPYDHAGVTFDYLMDRHQRPGPDGQGGRMLSIIHYTDSRTGAGWDNAAYYRDPGLGMVIVVGDGSVFPPFHLSRGVFYHEWGHAFTEATCNLGYGNDDEGGMNECGSDIKAALAEHWYQKTLGQPWKAGEVSWLLAPELFSMGLHGRALRDFLVRTRGPAYDDPLLGVDPQIATYDQMRRGLDPHVSSSIGNGWFAEACRQFPEKGSWESIGPIWYEVWTTTRMPKRPTYRDFARATVDVATERYGVNSAELAAVRYGWDAVKVPIPTVPAPPPTTPDTSPCALSDAEILALVRHPSIQKAAARFGATLAQHAARRTS